MSAIKVDTNSLQACIDDITTTKKYYAGKVSTFSGSFGGGGNLGGYLTQVRNNYQGIVNNLDKVINYIKEYKTDIENIENNTNFSGSTSGISTTRMQGSTVNGISKSVLFDLGVSYDGTDYNYKDTYNQLLSMKDYKEAGKWWANASICGLSFLEGMGNVVEGLVDGGGWLVSGACSILGFDETAEKVGNFVKKDISKDLYYDAVRATGLDRYADPNGTAANIASIAGNVVGNVALSYLTGLGIANVFGVGTNAASIANSIVNAGRRALTDSGIGMEIALQRGASLKEAQTAAGLDAVIGSAIGVISGQLDADVRLYGVNGNLGKVLGFSMASGGVSAIEPLLNDVNHTGVYHYDKSKSYWDNFKTNFVNDGVATQMLMAGGMGSLGTLSNGIKQYSNYSKNIKILQGLTDEEIQLKMDEYNNLLDSSEELKKIIKNEGKGSPIPMSKDVYDDYIKLKTLQAEIETEKNLTKEFSMHEKIKDIYHKKSNQYYTLSTDEYNEIKSRKLQTDNELFELSKRFGKPMDVVRDTIDSKLQSFVDESEFGTRRSYSTLMNILKTGRVKNQFETGQSSGLYDPTTRLEVEEDVFGVPKNANTFDRPNYGMAFPKLSESTMDYYLKGPGSWYGGNSAIIIFDKAKVSPQTTFTLGDSLDFHYHGFGCKVEDPHYMGLYNGIFDSAQSLRDVKKANLQDLFRGDLEYLEIQYHGIETHSTDVIKEVIFPSNPPSNIVDLLNNAGISYRTIK